MSVKKYRTNPVLNICILQPPGYIHALGLLEAAEYVTEKSILAGYQAALIKNRLLPGGLNIVFGAHLHPQANLAFPPNTVIFNTEQIPEKSVWINSQYKSCLDRHFVWDYSEINLAAIGHERKRRVDFFHVEKLRRIARTHAPECDLIFYGSMNDRRNAIINKLRSKGLTVVTVFGLYGAERDALLAKARAVLNLHFYDSQIFQQIRAFYALSNDIPVISENFPKNSAPDLYWDVIFTPGHERFEEFVPQLMAQKERFDTESRKRIERFQEARSNMEFESILADTIDAVLGSAAELPKPQVPTRINIGSGKDYRMGYLNIDILPTSHPDIVYDLSASLQFPISIPSPVYGKVVLDENRFDEIVAIDVLEHVPQLTKLMDNCLSLLKEGGEFKILVPYDLSLGAWQDPTHVRAFNENSWMYYTEWFWYLGWFDYRFDLTHSEINLSAYGKKLVEKNTPHDVLLLSPRAIDSMRVILTKRKTTPEEKTLARAYSNSFLMS